MKKNIISPYEQELILAHILKKSREYVSTRPELKLTKLEEKKLQAMTARRRKNEPLAYILGQKGFYGLDFKVNRHTLIPRPETEHLVELVTGNLQLATSKNNKIAIIDVGTGSGNIIISIAKNLRTSNVHYGHLMSFYGIDISEKALKIAKINAKKYKLDNPPAGGIKFIRSNLLSHFLNNPAIKQFNHLIIVANLPYLSEKIYNSTAPDVKNYEPQSALLSGIDGLDHYKKLLQQIKTLKENCSMFHVSCYMEISPEQKTKISKLIKTSFPKCKPSFQRDLASRWRIAIFSI
ncbi:MAG TPA: peptide chain release factor N(5)-glutamine methyltransferase [Candidatus Moranbacteria bacterium]|nr:peptide chain release factor N(5)-glutamine methyltransferase [Candidatus Moranbacteria bacterium]